MNLRAKKIFYDELLVEFLKYQKEARETLPRVSYYWNSAGRMIPVSEWQYRKHNSMNAKLLKKFPLLAPFTIEVCEKEKTEDGYTKIAGSEYTVFLIGKFTARRNKLFYSFWNKIQ